MIADCNPTIDAEMKRDVLQGISKSRVNRAGETLRKAELGNLELTDAEVAQEREVVAAFRTAHGRPLATVAANLRYYAQEESRLRPVEVGQRLKRIPTVIDKLVRHPEMKLARMQDIGGCRAVVGDEAEARAIAARLHSAPGWDIAREYDYIATPKDDGYRALHVIERRHGCEIEVQLRTRMQHAWAELIESIDRSNIFMELKTGRAPEVLREYYRLGAELMATRDRGEELSEALLHEFRSVHERISRETRRSET